jgi:hypothetical protein
VSERRSLTGLSCDASADEVLGPFMLLCA